MSERVLAFLVVFLIASGAVLPLQAQTLSPDQRAKLDGRFEQVLRQDAQETLMPAIEALPGPDERRVRGAPRSEAGPAAKADASAGRPEALPSTLSLNVRPSAYQRDGTPVYKATVHASDASALEEAGVQVNSTFQGVATVRATPAQLRTLSRLETVRRVQSPRRVQLHNDVAAAEVGARTLNQGVGGTAYQGQDVMACVIDSGIDWSHPDFTSASGRTRIHSIWDQADDSTSVPSPAQNDGSRFGQDFNPSYGAEYLTQDIQQGNVQQKDRNGHGTHVAGTVASSGQAYKQSSGVRKYRGVAPAADIIAVNSDLLTNTIIDGVNYCKQVAEAEGKPVVVNMSLGTNFGPHDGTSFFAQAIDAITSDGTLDGTVVVTSAGNSGSPRTPIHTSGSIAAGDSADVSISVSSYEPNAGELNDFYQAALWTYQDGPYSLSVYTPQNQDTLTVSVEGTAAPDTLLETPRGAISVESATSGSARYFQVVGLDASSGSPPEEGDWTLRLRSEGDQQTDYHGWFGGSSNNIEAAFENADNKYTIGIPATARSAIAVGAYVQRNRWSGQLGQYPGAYPRDQTASFSSRGPTVDGRQKPAITAPGAFTASAYTDDASSPLFGSGFTVGDGEHQLVSGTSMSAPVMAGTAALLLQEDSSLSTNDVRDLVTKTARADDVVEQATSQGSAWNDTYGFGKLNALKAMTRLRDDLSSASVDLLTYEDAFTKQAEAEATVGEGGAERLAVRFTPTTSGALTGLYLTLGSSAEANSLTDSVYVQVWSNDIDDTPKRAIGERVAVPAGQLTSYTPNFVPLRQAQVGVTADTDYHLVLTPKDNGGTLDVLAEDANASTGRSSVLSGSSWSDTGTDLVMRAQVGGGLSTEDKTAPFPVGRPTATTAADSVTLDWDAFPAGDVDKYRVYRDTAPIDSTAGPEAISALDSVSAQTTRYVDKSVTVNTQYYYRVTAVDEADNESGFTGEATATPKVPPNLAASPTSASQTINLGASTTSSVQVENTAAQGAEVLDFAAFVLPDPPKKMRAQRLAQGAPSWQSLTTLGTKARAATQRSAKSLPHTLLPPPIVSDPTDDTESGEVNVTQVRAGVQAESLNVVIEHATSIAPDNYAGVMSFDVDRETATGTDPIAANPEQELGTEYAVVFSDPGSETALLVDTERSASGADDSQVVAEIPLAVEGNALHLAVPLAKIDGTLPFNTTGVVGTSDAPTDWFPNAGNVTVGGEKWLAVSPTSGEVAAGQTEELTLTYDASRQAPGTYDAVVRLQSNDPDDGPTDVSVSMTVEGLAPPSELAGTTEGTDASLDWNEATGGSASKYNVYRQTTPIPDDFADLSPVGSVSGGTTTFTDTEVTAGRTYYYRVSAVDGSGNETALSPEASVFLYPETVEANVSRSFGEAGTASNYRLVALPGAIDRPLSETMEGKAGLDWQAYWDDGSAFVKFDGSSTFSFQPGHGFWLNSADDWAVQTEVETVPLKGDTATTIPLHEGWNIVSNPIGKPVSFAAIQAAHSGDLSPFWTFNGAFAKTDTMRSARTGVAYYFRNRTGLDSLTIPYPGAPTQKSVSNTAGDGTFALAAHPRGAGGETASIVRVGFDPATRTGLDKRDLMAPPGRFEVVSLRLDAPGSTSSGRQNGLLTERRPPPSGTGAEAGHTFALRLHARTDAPVHLNARHLDALGDREVVLLNAATGKTHDLHATSSVTLDPTDETRALKLAVGSAAYVEQQAEQVKPEKVALTSYPNPMHQQGTLEYAVPEETTVRLEVYDILGRKVATLVNRKKDAGRYRVQVETDRLSSGVYFGRLRTDGQTRTQKITVVR